jgi:pimeloyl-ACP methyl ester carboxylesterase
MAALTGGRHIMMQRPRVGGSGPAVVLLHGYGETGDMWEPLAVKLATNHTVIVPDLRGMGLSSRPPGGYDKKTQGRDIAGVLDNLKIEHADLVTRPMAFLFLWPRCRTAGQRP